jgi:outer membrane lipoprotein SlyB
MFLRATVLLLALALPASFAQAQTQKQRQAAASKAANATPRIDGFDVEPSAQLDSGNELSFTLYGSPGGIASVRIGGSTSGLSLDEVEAGVYEGTYTISRRDRISKDSTATANLRLGNKVASSVLDESLAAGAPARWPGGSATATGVPTIDRFDVEPLRSLTPGAELPFRLTGSPNGSASVRINGVRGKLALEEVRAGVYEGAYTVRNRDQFPPDAVVTGNLRLGTQERSVVLGQSLVDGTASRPRAGSRASNRAQAQAPIPAAAPACANCGVVEAVNQVQHKGDGSFLGKIGGGVVGALLGSQVGHGTGNTVATVAGAAGGAWAGNEIEKRVKTTTHYEVVVRLQGGGTQTVSYSAQPGFAVGTRVRVDNGALVRL